MSDQVSAQRVQQIAQEHAHFLRVLATHPELETLEGWRYTRDIRDLLARVWELERERDELRAGASRAAHVLNLLDIPPSHDGE